MVNMVIRIKITGSSGRSVYDVIETMERSAVLKKLEKQEEFRKKFSEFADMRLQELVLTDDIKKIREQIERHCKEYLQAQKRFEKAEKEYLEAKVDLFLRGEEKEKLIETLKTIIQKNEFEKAQKLSSLVGKLEIKSKVIIEEEAKNT